jgi:hypothetical protein
MQIKKPPIWSTYGGLGPNLDSDKVITGRAVLCKISDFSNQLREFNKTKVYKSTSHGQNEQTKQLTSRERGKEYAKSIPRVWVCRNQKREIDMCAQSTTSESIGDRLLSLLREHYSKERVINQIRLKYGPSS